jgi:hypothetical protein
MSAWLELLELDNIVLRVDEVAMLDGRIDDSEGTADKGGAEDDICVLEVAGEVKLSPPAEDLGILPGILQGEVGKLLNGCDDDTIGSDETMGGEDDPGLAVRTTAEAGTVPLLIVLSDVERVNWLPSQGPSREKLFRQS